MNVVLGIRYLRLLTRNAALIVVGTEEVHVAVVVKTEERLPLVVHLEQNGHSIPAKHLQTTTHHMPLLIEARVLAFLERIFSTKPCKILSWKR